MAERAATSRPQICSPDARQVLWLERMPPGDPQPPKPSLECSGLAASARSGHGWAVAGLLVAGLCGIAVAAAATSDQAEPSPATPSPLQRPEKQAAKKLPAAEGSGPAASARLAEPSGSISALLSTAHFDAASGHFVARGPGGGTERLTLVPELQRSIERLLATYRMPLGEIVALEPASGRILAMARSQTPGEAGDGLETTEAFPAASVFKLVTATALLERGVSPTEEICYHGGKHRLHARELVDDDRRDRRCTTLAQAVAHSTNVAIAKLAARNIDPVWLRDWADRLLFDHRLPMDAETAFSTATVPADRFDFASTAAGFGDVELNPLHAAALAAAIGHDGLLVPLHVLDDAGAPHADPARLMPARLARELTAMMALAVREGTARKAFRTRLARRLEAAGKTGSISTHGPFRDYSWFVGFAPALDPQIAVAVLVVNGLRWRVHASTLAEATMQAYLRPPRAQELRADRR